METKSGKKVFNSILTTDTNSRPLSLCEIRGGPKTKNSLRNLVATSRANSFFKENAHEYLPT
jgi:hypothetical protein